MIHFTKPLFLLLLIPLGIYTFWVSRNSLADISRFRARLSIGLRAVILLALIFSLAGARMVKNAPQQCVIFAVDVSESISKADQQAALEYINNALKHVKRNQKIGLIAFGGNASAEIAPSNIRKIDKIYSVPETNETNISQALGLALASFPENSAKKIVLITDGNQTSGSALEQALLAGSNDVSVDVVPITSRVPQEVLLDKMLAPTNAKVGEPFDLKVVAEAQKPTTATIRLLRNGSPISTKKVTLSTGKSIFAFKQSIPKQGNYEFKAILECEADTSAENNTALAYTMVKGKPRVLYVEGQPGQEKYLTQALGSNDIDIKARNTSGIPGSLAEIRGYDAIVISDVPAWSMSPEQMALIKSGVKDLGIGFTMIGGENSFGAGGYFATPIEEALPVDMSVRKKKVLPSLTVVIVMDKSGSMGMEEGGKEKIQLANDAAAAVVKLLQPIDRVGVIVCHDFPVAAVPIRQADNKSAIYREISTIRAEGGGIAVFPSIKMANDLISKSPTRQKHVILLADGADCDQQGGVIPLVKQMTQKKITISTVAIGDGPHVPFLKAVAATGKGGYYLARQARDLKAIFTKDVMTISKSLIIEEPFKPRSNPASEELAGIDIKSIPPLLGYVTSSPKPTAGVSMASPQNDPILASWQYGLGKSAAFTSDCKSRWATHWLIWPGYGKFWSQVVRSTLRKSSSQDFQTVVQIEGGRAHVIIDAVDESGNFLNALRFRGSVVDSDMKTREIAIQQTGPGRYEAYFDARKVGTYVVNVLREDQKDVAPEVAVVSIPYPPEYKNLSPNISLLQQIAYETKGQFNPQPQQVFTQRFRVSKTYSDLWPILVLLAAIVLPFDVAVRRVAFGPELAKELFGKVAQRARSVRRKRRDRRSERVETVGSLLQAKKARSTNPETADNKPHRVTLQPEVDTPSPNATKSAQPVINVEKPKETKQDEPERNPLDDSPTARLLAAKKRARERKE